MSLGRLGEDLGCRFLESHGVVIVQRNLLLEGGEIDAICLDGSVPVLAEIRTTTSTRYPLDAIGPVKRDQLVKLATRVTIKRIDLLGVGINNSAVVFHWAPGVV